MAAKAEILQYIDGKKSDAFNYTFTIQTRIVQHPQSGAKEGTAETGYDMRDVM